jgi:hypothetical protein
LYLKNKKVKIMKGVLIFGGCYYPACNKTKTLLSINELPNIVIGREYRININTPDSILSYMYVEGQDELIWNGLKITTPVNEYYVGNGTVTISGIPVKERNIFYVQGSNIGTQCPGVRFNKLFKVAIIK